MAITHNNISKTCTACGEIKPLTSFSPNGKGFRASCKECRRVTPAHSNHNKKNMNSKNTSNIKKVGDETLTTSKLAKNKTKKNEKISRGTHTTAYSNITTDTDLGSALERLLDPVQQQYRLAGHQKTVKKAQWDPASVTVEGNTGNIVTRPMSQQEVPSEGNWGHLLAEFGLDPEQYEVVEPVNMSSREVPDKEGFGTIWLTQARARIRKRTSTNHVNELNEICSIIDGWKIPKKKQEKVRGEGVFSVVIGDWQTGGNENGSGSEALVGRVAHMIDSVKERITELRKLGRPISVLQVLCVGDLIENCDGFYANQLATTDLDLRSQVTATKRLLARAIAEWSTLFPEVRVIAVGGNHGENRSSGAGGKLATTWADNWDLQIVESIADAFAMNPDKFGHVKFLIPREDLSVTFDCAGWIFGITHGHLARTSGNAEQKLYSWYKNMAAGGLPIGDAHVIVSGHFHHYRNSTLGKAQWLQCPAIDSGSRWFLDSTGQHSDPGLLTFCTYPESRVTDVQILEVPIHLRNNPQASNSPHFKLSRNGRPQYQR